MRGPQPFDLLPPLAGVRFDLADHLVSTSSIPGYIESVISVDGSKVSGIGSSNVFIDENGLMVPRQGYATVDNQISVPAERIMGIFGAFGASDTSTPAWQLGAANVLATTTRMYVRVSNVFGTTDTGWVEATGNNLFGTADTPARFVAFDSGGQLYFLMVNQGVAFPGLGRQTFTNGIAGLAVMKVQNSLAGFSYSQQHTGFYDAADIETLTNRVVVVNTMLQTDGSTDPYRVQWSAINDHTSWPVLGFASLNDGGYLDQIIAIRRVSQTSAAIYRERSIWIMYAVAGNDANAFAFERVVGADGIIGPCSPAAVVNANGQQYYLGLNNRIYHFSQSGIEDISAPVHALLDATVTQLYVNRAFGFWIQNKNLLVFVYPGNGSTTPNLAVVYNLRTQQWDSLWALTHPMSTGALVPDFNTLFQPGGFYNNFLAPGETTDLAGKVQRFFVGLSTDNGSNPIQAVYSSPLFRINQLNASLVDSIEVYFKQAALSEHVTVTILGLKNPYDSAPVVITSMDVDLNNTASFFQKLPAGVNAANNTRANFFKVVIFSNGVYGQMAFGGGTVFTNPDPRGDSTLTQ